MSIDQWFRRKPQVKGVVLDARTSVKCTPEQYDVIQQQVAGERVYMEYITPELVDVLLSALRDRGYITSASGGWRGNFGEAFLVLTTWTPTVVRDDDPLVFCRKMKAYTFAKDEMTQMWHRGVIQGLQHLVQEQIRQEMIP